MLNAIGNRNYVAAKYEDGKKAGQCDSTRAFCSECSSMLWVYDEQWKQARWTGQRSSLHQFTADHPILPTQWVYPFASAIDTPLPKVSHGDAVKKGTDQEEDSPVMLCILRSSAPDTVPVPEGCVVYDSYPPGKGIEVSFDCICQEKDRSADGRYGWQDWHKKNKLWVD